MQTGQRLYVHVLDAGRASKPHFISTSCSCLELSCKRAKPSMPNAQECARVNAAKLHMKWRSVMRNAKAEELRGAVSALAQRFERAIDRRDLLIQARMPPAGQ